MTYDSSKLNRFNLIQNDSHADIDEDSANMHKVMDATQYRSLNGDIASQLWCRQRLRRCALLVILHKHSRAGRLEVAQEKRRKRSRQQFAGMIHELLPAEMFAE